MKQAVRYFLPALFFAFSLISAQGQSRKFNRDAVSSTRIFDQMVFDYPPLVRAKDDKNTYLISIDITLGKLYMMYSAVDNETGRLVFNKEVEASEPDALPRGNSELYDVLPLSNGKTAIIFKHRVTDRSFVRKSRHGLYLLYARMIDNKTGRMEPKAVFISDIRRRNYSDIYNVFLEHSPDRKQLIMHETVGDGENYRSIFHILNQDLQEADSFEDEGRIARGDLKKLIVDNEGSIYTVSFYEGDYVVTSYDAFLGYEKWEEVMEFNFPTGEGMVYSSLSTFLNGQGQLILAGMMEEKAEETYEPLYQFTAALDIETKETEFTELSPIDREEIIYPLVDPKDLKKAKKKGEPIEFTGFFNESSFFIKPSGGFYYVAQEYKHYVGYDSYGTKISEAYFYGDLIVFNIDEKGKVLWAQPIRQDQELRKPGYGSFAGFTLGDDLMLFYNTDEDNFRLPENERLKTMKKERGMVSVQLQFDDSTGEREEDRLNIIRTAEDAPLAPSSYYQRHFDTDVILIGAAKRGMTRYFQLHRIDRTKL